MRALRTPTNAITEVRSQRKVPPEVQLFHNQYDARLIEKSGWASLAVPPDSVLATARISSCRPGFMNAAVIPLHLSLYAGDFPGLDLGDIFKSYVYVRFATNSIKVERLPSRSDRIVRCDLGSATEEEARRCQASLPWCSSSLLSFLTATARNLEAFSGLIPLV